MRRREFIPLVVSAAMSNLWPFASRADRKIPRVGWLFPGIEALQENLEGYRSGMRDLGYREGVNVETEYLYADGQFDRLPMLAATLVANKVDVIVTFGTPGCLAAKQATKVIPIVFAVSGDPISTGVVTNLSRPEGNITGQSIMATDLSAKRMELLQMLVPSIRQVAMLWNSSNPAMTFRMREARQAAQQLNVAFLDSGAGDLDSLEARFAVLSERPPEALLVTAEGFTNRYRDQILDFALRHRIPAMYEDGSFAIAGGLIAYGPNIKKMFYSAASYVDKILKGAKPADLPVEQPTKFELTINIKTAKAVGIEIPPILLARADEVIE